MRLTLERGVFFQRSLADVRALKIRRYGLA